MERKFIYFFCFLFFKKKKYLFRNFSSNTHQFLSLILLLHLSSSVRTLFMMRQFGLFAICSSIELVQVNLFRFCLFLRFVITLFGFHYSGEVFPRQRSTITSHWIEKLKRDEAYKRVQNNDRRGFRIFAWRFLRWSFECWSLLSIVQTFNLTSVSCEENCSRFLSFVSICNRHEQTQILTLAHTPTSIHSPFFQAKMIMRSLLQEQN